MSPLMRSFVAGQLAFARDMTYFLAPYITPTSASRSAPSRRPRPYGAATTAPPASGCAARAAKHPHRMPHRRRTTQSLLAFAALIAGRLAGIAQKLTRSKRRFPATPMAGRRCPRCRKPCARRPNVSTNPRCCAPRSATAWSITMCTPRSGSSSNTTGGSRIGN